MAEMRKLTAYFSQWCPESRWNAATEQIFDNLFHPDCQIVGKKQTFHFQDWKDWYRRSIEENQIIDMEKVVQESPNSIVYTLLIHQDGDATAASASAVIRHTAKGIFQDGKLIRTEPVNPEIYDIMTATKKRKSVLILWGPYYLDSQTGGRTGHASMLF